MKLHEMTSSICFTCVLLTFWIVNARGYEPHPQEYVDDNEQRWKTPQFVLRRPLRPQNLLTIRDFMQRRGLVHRDIGEDLIAGARADESEGEQEYNSDPGREDELSELKDATSVDLPPRTDSSGESPVANQVPAVVEDDYLGEDTPSSKNSSSLEDAFAKHVVGDVITGFKYFRGIFADAVSQADAIADKYLEFEEGRWFVEQKAENDVTDEGWFEDDHGDVFHEEVEHVQARSSTALPHLGSSSDDRDCTEHLSRCRQYDHASLARRSEDGMTLEEAEARGRRRKKKKFLKKLLLPLLLSYKLKFFALVPVIISGLVLLVGSTGLAGFFFALFAAVVSIKNAHSS